MADEQQIEGAEVQSGPTQESQVQDGAAAPDGAPQRRERGARGGRVPRPRQPGLGPGGTRARRSGAGPRRLIRLEHAAFTCLCTASPRPLAGARWLGKARRMTFEPITYPSYRIPAESIPHSLQKVKQKLSAFPYSQKASIASLARRTNANHAAALGRHAQFSARIPAIAGPA